MSTLASPWLQAYLALHEHVKELVPRLLGVPIATQVPQVVMSDTQTRQAAHAGPLVVQPATLRAGNEVEELLSLWGGRQRGLGCGAQRVRPKAGHPPPTGQDLRLSWGWQSL